MPDSATGVPARPAPNAKQEKPKREAKDPKTGIPTAIEWQEFLGLTVLRLITEGYLWLVLFRDIDESDLTSRERELVRLTKEDLTDIAAPMATVVSKNRIARKHGRSIIAMADSYESIIDLFIWMRRVNRIARKYRRQQTASTETVQGDVVNGQVFGSDEPQGPFVFNPGHHG